MTTITELPNTTFVRPNERQISALRALGVALAPQLSWRDDDDRQRHLEAFAAAFDFIGCTLSRSVDDKLDLSRGASWWCDAARDWCSRRGVSADILTKDFTLAVLAHGTISHSYLPGRYPHDLSFGLALGGGKAITNGWLYFLECGQLKHATALPAAYYRHQVLAPIIGAR